jgi:hypothetical protein
VWACVQVGGLLGRQAGRTEKKKERADNKKTEQTSTV